MHKVKIRVKWNDVSPTEYPTLFSEMQQAANLALFNTSAAIQMIELDHVSAKVNPAILIDPQRKAMKTFFGENDSDGQRWYQVLKTLRDVQILLATGEVTFELTKANLNNDRFYAETDLDADSGRVRLFKSFVTTYADGKDSQWGTVLHELTHNVVNDVTDQNATYSQQQVKILARDHPDKAIRCAECYEYFVEFLTQDKMMPFAVEKTMTTGWDGQELYKQQNRNNGALLRFHGIANVDHSMQKIPKSHKKLDPKPIVPNESWLKATGRSFWLGTPDGTNTAMWSVPFEVGAAAVLGEKTIVGRWAADNGAAMYLYDIKNNHQTKVSGISGQVFDKWTDFYIGVQHGLVRHRKYELRFFVSNMGGPGGLRVETAKFNSV